jgi:threonine/homoserine/homoserine lactone efflux protein
MIETIIFEIVGVLLSGMLVGLASSVTVGPVAVLCIQRTLSKGHLSGLFSGLGIACADTLMAILSFTVYALLKSSIDEYHTAIQICGGVFVVIVGIFIFFKNPVPQIRKNRTGRSNLWQDFASMFGFTLANFVVVIPYILAFFTMFNIDLSGDLVTTTTEVEIIADPVLDAARSAHDEVVQEVVTTTTTTTPSPISPMFRNALVIAGFLLGAVGWWGILTFVINLFRRRFRPRHMLTINHVAGIVISTLGLYTLISVLIS